jgi:Ring hydroxylating beta subunit
MSSILEKPSAAAKQLSLEDVRQFLYREARFLDDKEWENWLALYAPELEFWMPSWDDDDQHGVRLPALDRMMSIPPRMARSGSPWNQPANTASILGRAAQT